MSVVAVITHSLQTNLQQFIFAVGRRLLRQKLELADVNGGQSSIVGWRMRHECPPKTDAHPTMKNKAVNRRLPRQNTHKNHHKSVGFTLLEVMMVVMVIGIMASFIQFNVGGDTPDKQLKKASDRFVAIFDAAAEYGLLNNIELGLYINKNRYQFLGYDGVRWSDVPDQALLAEHTLPEGLKITLSLDDLPIEEPLLFDANVLIEQQKNVDNDGSADGSANKKEKANKNSKTSNKNKNTNKNKQNNRVKKRIPQVYLLSGGDISAFSLTFSLSEEALTVLDLEPEENIAYRVMGLYSTPLKVERVDFQGEPLEQQ